MGLDTTAYQNVEHLPLHPAGVCGDDDGDSCWEAGHKQAFVYDTFPHGLEGLPGHVTLLKSSWAHSQFLTAGWYRVNFSDDNPTTHASYSGHSAFRHVLRQLADWAPPSALVDSGDELPQWYRDQPFFELVYFADNEGVLGPTACENLYEDFIEYGDKAARTLASDDPYDWEHRHYLSWLKSVAFARHGGFIHFH